jgi:hypothetical protein
MEVLFRFLNWVSSFHTVDEESGNKMDTWNIATVMAPNILRESNDKEMRNVDQGAVKVVFDLIENNDEFSEVRNSPPFYANGADLTRYLLRSWNYCAMTPHQTCLPKRSCDNGNSEARTPKRQHQPWRRPSSKAEQLPERTNGTHRK